MQRPEAFAAPPQSIQAMATGDVKIHLPSEGSFSSAPPSGAEEAQLAAREQEQAAAAVELLNRLASFQRYSHSFIENMIPLKAFVPKTALIIVHFSN
jgi:hypothetical protein